MCGCVWCILIFANAQYIISKCPLEAERFIFTEHECKAYYKIVFEAQDCKYEGSTLVAAAVSGLVQKMFGHNVFTDTCYSLQTDASKLNSRTYF